MIELSEDCPDKIFGTNLRAVRERWGLSLRDVQERSAVLAKSCGQTDFYISASWLQRVEAGSSGLSATKLITLSVIYSLTSEALLSLHAPGGVSESLAPPISFPNATLLLNGGVLDRYAKALFPEEVLRAVPPESTQLLSGNEGLPEHFRRGIVGLQDITMDPMILPGSIVLIDTQKRTIAKRRTWTNEFNRPLYFLLTRKTYLIGFCEFDRDEDWLTVVPHALSRQTNQRWRYRKEIEVVGQIAGYLSRRY